MLQQLEFKLVNFIHWPLVFSLQNFFKVFLRLMANFIQTPSNDVISLDSEGLKYIDNITKFKLLGKHFILHFNEMLDCVIHRLLTEIHCSSLHTFISSAVSKFVDQFRVGIFSHNFLKSFELQIS